MPGVIRIGHKGIDNHCMMSTLEGEMGSLLDQFRRNCLKEYFQAIRMCQEKGVVLTPELLDRGMRVLNAFDSCWTRVLYAYDLA